MNLLPPNFIFIFGDDIKLCHWVPKGSIFLKIDQNQLSFLFGFYLKIRDAESSKGKRYEPGLFAIPDNPPTNPFDLLDISTIKKQVALPGNQHWFKEVKVSIGKFRFQTLSEISRRPKIKFEKKLIDGQVFCRSFDNLPSGEFVFFNIRIWRKL